MIQTSESGGNGARFLGIGGSQQYRVDEVTVSLRLISISSVVKSC
jgi:curli production assembly/transport component CsgG